MQIDKQHCPRHVDTAEPCRLCCATLRLTSYTVQYRCGPCHYSRENTFFANPNKEANLSASLVEPSGVYMRHGYITTLHRTSITTLAQQCFRQQTTRVHCNLLFFLERKSKQNYLEKHRRTEFGKRNTPIKDCNGVNLAASLDRIAPRTESAQKACASAVCRFKA